MGTAEFLAVLDPRPDARFVIETYTDAPKGSNKASPDPLSGQWPGSTQAEVLALIPELARRNETGAGVFVAVNEFNGSRRKANIKRVRGIHADFDGADIGLLAAAFKAVPPTILVESSPSKFHGYWLTSDGEVMDPETAEAINKRMVKDHGADPAAIDCSRLLRLPGFRHMKNRAADSTPTVRLLKVTGRRYTVDELKVAYPPVATIKHQTTPITPSSAMPANNPTVAQLAEQCAQDEPLLWQGSWQQRFPSQSEADMALAGCIARRAVQADIPEQERINILEAVFSQSGLGTRDKWQTRPDYRARTLNAAFTQLQSVTQGAPALAVDEQHGDVLNGRAFSRLWRNKLKYVPSAGKWLKWSGV